MTSKAQQKKLGTRFNTEGTETGAQRSRRRKTCSAGAESSEPCGFRFLANPPAPSASQHYLLAELESGNELAWGDLAAGGDARAAKEVCAAARWGDALASRATGARVGRSRHGRR